MEVKHRIPDGVHTGHAHSAGLPHSLDTSWPRTFPRLVQWAAARYGDRVFLPRRTSRGGEPVTFAALAEDVVRVAEGLAACGVGRGDRVAILAENRYEWLLADLATVFLGAIDVPRGADTSPAEMREILGHAGCRFAFVDDDRLAREVLGLSDDLPELGHVCVLRDRTMVSGAFSLPELRARGERWSERHPDRVADVAAAVSPEDVLTIVYTSGTTAEPKGVMLTHDNVLSNVFVCGRILRFGRDDVLLSLLPSWHMYERTMEYVALERGATMVYTDRRRMKEDFRTVRPTAFAAVPRVWEMVHDGIVGSVARLRGPRRALMQLVLRTCRRVGAREAKPLDRLLHRIFSRTVLPRIHDAVGGRLRLAVSGGGSLPPHVDACLLGLGFPLLNGYGLTETSPVAAVRLPEDNRPGTIGPPIPGTEIQVRSPDGRVLPPGETGVLWIRGPQVMKGYYRNAARTAEVLDEGGWFNTGDLGHIEPDGHVCITGRAKDTIVLAGGENIEPEPIEAAIKTSDYIEQAVVVGQDRKQLGALLVAAKDTLAEVVPPGLWRENGGILHGPQVRALMRRELDRLCHRARGFRPVERVARFVVLSEPLTVENGTLTPTMKVRRHVVHERYRRLIEEMFAEGAA